MGVDIATLGLEIRSDGVVVAGKRLQQLTTDAKKTEVKTKSSLKKIGAAATSLKAKFFSLKTAMLGLGVGIVVHKSLKAFSTLDSGLIAVQKTTGAAADQLKEISERIQKMALIIPVTTGHLLDLAAVGGQLGQKTTEDLMAFTQTLAMLEVAGDIIGPEMATNLARLQGITGGAIKDIGVLGAVITVLGNEMKTTEAPIVHMAAEIGRGVAIYGASAEQVAALSASMVELAIQAEAGGTIITKAFGAIDNSLRSGGDSMQSLMKITKLSEEQLRIDWAEDSMGVFRKFISGIGELQEAGESAKDIFEQFGLTGARVDKVLPIMAKRIDVLTKAFRLMDAQMQNPTALFEETINASKSFENQMILTGNAVDQIFASIGGVLAPVIIDLAADFRDWVEVNQDFIKQDLPGEIKDIAEGVGSLFKQMGDFATSDTSKFMMEYWEVMAGALIGLKAGGGLGALIGAGAGGFYSAGKDLKEAGYLESTRRTEIEQLEHLYVLQARLNKLFETGTKEQYPAQAAGLARVNLQIAEFEARLKSVAKVTNDINKSKGILTHARLINDAMDQMAAAMNAVDAKTLTDKENALSEELKYRIDILGADARTQYISNMARKEGIDLTIDSGKAIGEQIGAYYDLQKALEDLKKAQKECNKIQDEANRIFDETRTPLEALEIELNRLEHIYNNSSMSLDTYNRAVNAAGQRFVGENEDVADEVKAIWESTRNEIQNTISEFFRRAGQGGFESFKDMIGGLGESAGAIFSAKFSEQITDSLIGDGNLAKEFKNLFGGVFEGTGEEIAAGILGTLSAGIAAAQSGNPYQMAGAGAGAAIGLAISGGNPMGMAAGASVGGALGGLFGGDDEPSYMEKLRESIADLIKALHESTLAALDQVRGTSDFDIAVRDMRKAITVQDIEGQNYPLAGEFEVIGGMKRRDKNWSDYVSHGPISLVKDKGHTTVSLDPESTREMIDDLYKSMDMDKFYELMVETQTDPGALVDALLAAGLLSPGFPERSYADYSDPTSAKGQKTRLAAEGVVAEMEDHFAQMALIGANYVDSLVGLREKYEDISSLSKELRDTRREFEPMAETASKILAANQAMIDLGKESFLTAEQIHELEIAEKTYFAALDSIKEKYEEKRHDILSNMRTELAIADGSMAQYEQNVLSITKSSDDYYDSLIDAGNTAENARIQTDAWAASMKEAMLATMLTADRNSYNLKILQALGKEEEYLNLQRSIELAAIDAMYGAGEDAAIEIRGLAEELWGIEDAATAAAETLNSFHKTQVGFWINVRKEMEAAFKPEYMLDFLSEPGFNLKGLGLDSLLQPQNTAEFAFLMDTITALGNAGEITESQWRSLADFGFSSFTTALDEATQAIEDETASRAAARSINQRSIDWRNSFKPISDLAQDFKDIEDTMEAFRKEILAAGYSVSNYWLKGAAVEKEIKLAVLDEWQKKMLSTISDLRFSLSGSDSVAGLINNQLIPLIDEYNDIAADNYTDQIQSLRDQANILTQIRDIQVQQLEETINNYKAIQDTIYSLQGGSLAAVQSVEFFERRYAQLLEDAQTGDSADISALNSFITQYADFMDDYGGDYATLTQSIISDLIGLQNGITGGATLDDLESRLADLNEDILAGVPTDMATIIANLDRIWAEVYGVTLSSSSTGYLPQFASGGAYKGGLAMVGESGPELINTNPGTIHSNIDTSRIIASAVAGAIANVIGSNESGDVYLQVDGEVFAKVIGRQLRSGQPDLVKPLIKMTKAA